MQDIRAPRNKKPSGANHCRAKDGASIPGLLLKCISAVVVLATAEAARAEEVPALNLDPVCRGIAQQAATPGERGGPDLTFAHCVKSEQATRERLN